MLFCYLLFLPTYQWFSVTAMFQSLEENPWWEANSDTLKGTVQIWIFVLA